MPRETYTVTSPDYADPEIVRHYPFTADGFDAAANLARLRGYNIWQSFDGAPRYLLWEQRQVLEEIHASTRSREI